VKDKAHNNPLAADGWDISMENQRLLAAAEGERYREMVKIGIIDET
jgi:hypothetical protein